MPDDELLLDAAARSVRYLEYIDGRNALPSADSLARLDELGTALPEHGRPAKDVLALLDVVGSPATVGSAGGRYFGFVVGGAHPVSVAANWLATAWDQNAALVQMSPVAAHLDALAVTWMRDALRLPESAVGGLVTGATAANIVALAAARSHLLGRAGWDVESDGLHGAPPLRVIASAESHASIDKALMVLGFGTAHVTRVETDSQGRVRADRIPDLDDRTLVCLQAGHVHTGALDPIGEIARRAAGSGAWLHVDGAFGLWARVSSQFDALTDGLDLADSWATDAHKWLNVPYDSGAVFTRHDAAIRKAMSAWPPLLSEVRQPAAYTLEQSRRARGVDVWAVLSHLGREGVADRVEGSCAQARKLALEMERLGFEVVNDVVLNQVLVSFGDDERTRRVLESLDQDGVIGCTQALWKGRTLLRLSVSSWRTDDADLERSVAAIGRAAHSAGR